LEREKGKIRGVPFIDSPEEKMERLKLVVENPTQEDLLRVQFCHMRAQMNRMERRQKWSFSLVLVSIVISVVILAARFV
jgi:hypothetical protein